MNEIPDRTVDLVITDPPFAIDFKAKKSSYNRDYSKVLEGYNEIPKQEYASFTTKWMSQVKRILKDSGSMYVFSGWNNLKDILIALDELEFFVVNHIIWKYQFGVFTKRKYVTSHYHCLYVCINNDNRRFFPYSRFNKGAKDSIGNSIHYKDKEDVWIINREYWSGDMKTPTKLPAEIIEKILFYSSEEGDIVLDPFSGSGQVAILSKLMKRKYIGFEIEKRYYDFAKERLVSNSYRLKSKNKATAETLNLF